MCVTCQFRKAFKQSDGNARLKESTIYLIAEVFLKSYPPRINNANDVSKLRLDVCDEFVFGDAWCDT